MQDVWKRIETQFRLHAPKKLWRLTPGAIEEQIALLETLIGQRLPDDVRESYAIHNGAQGRVVPSDLDFDSFQVLLDIESIGRALANWREMLNGGEFEGLEPEPTGPVKRVWWSMGWVPIVGEGTGDHLCIDLDPPDGGSVGQVIDFGHEYGPTEVLSPSFRSYLEKYAADLESGAIRFDEDGELVRLDNPAA